MVYFEYLKESATYPEIDTLFNPSELYPEYPWGKANISTAENKVYEMVRKVLFELGLDKENFGTANWNPLGQIINVVILY